jgi:protein required for attachment to host cells
MKKLDNWIVIANSARAIVVKENGEEGSLTVVRLLRQDEARMSSGSDEDRDKRAPVSAARSPLERRIDPQRNLREHFAMQVAKFLDEGLAHRECAGVILVAANPFYGALRKHMSARLEKAIVRTVERDFTAVPLNRLRDRLARV